MEKFVEYNDTVPFWPPMYVSFLDHHGFELISFTFQKIVPTSLSQFDLSYAQTAAEFNTFSMNLRWNRYDIKRRVEEDPIV